jgi:hypothetical protein
MHHQKGQQRVIIAQTKKGTRLLGPDGKPIPINWGVAERVPFTRTQLVQRRKALAKQLRAAKYIQQVEEAYREIAEEKGFQNITSAIHRTVRKGHTAVNRIKLLNATAPPELKEVLSAFLATEKISINIPEGEKELRKIRSHLSRTPYAIRRNWPKDVFIRQVRGGIEVYPLTAGAAKRELEKKVSLHASAVKEYEQKTSSAKEELELLRTLNPKTQALSPEEIRKIYAFHLGKEKQ